MENLEDMVANENKTEEKTSEVNITSDENVFTLHADNVPFQLSMRITKFENDSEYSKFIKSVERMVRSSAEYKLWKSYLIDVLGMTTCVITDENLVELSLEVHHHVPSLYIITKGILNKMIDEDQKFCSFDVATKVIELHFLNQMGYVMLCSSMHEKFHNGFLDLPIESVRGNYMAFVNEYSQYLDDEDLDKINNDIQTTESNCEWNRNNYQSVHEG